MMPVPNLARFATFAQGIGAVPPVPPASIGGGTADGTQEHTQYQWDRNSVPPVPPVPPQNNDAWNESDLLDAYEERAAIMEYDGGLPRHVAEALAWMEVFGDRARAA